MMLLVLAKLGSLLFFLSLSVPVLAHTPLKLLRTYDPQFENNPNKTSPVLEPATGFFRTGTGLINYALTNTDLGLFNAECGVGSMKEPNTLISVSDIVIVVGLPVFFSFNKIEV
jgi:hypothetical protein